MDKIEVLYNKSKKQYIHFLKFTNPNKQELFNNSPNNLLELLDNSYKRKMRLKDQLIKTKTK